jgi:hypothetical protein
MSNLQSASSAARRECCKQCGGNEARRRQEGIRMQRRTQATQRGISRMKRRSGPDRPRVAALEVRARRALGDRPLVAVGAAVALGWMLGRALGARR